MGAYLAEPEKGKKTVHKKGNGFSFCSSEMQGWRKSMEDADIHETDLGDGNALFGVFDGHGGHEVSRYVEQIFINTLKNCSHYKKGSYKQALDLTFKTIDEMIRSKEGEAKLRQIRGNGTNESVIISSGCGCTANVILITKDAYFVANIGDSRSALRRGTTCVQLSQDHKPESENQQRRISNAGGEVVMGRVNGGLNLTRSFGDFDYKANQNLDYSEQMITCKPDIVKYDRCKDDHYIIMGCDGIWEKYVDDSQGLLKLVDGLRAQHSDRIEAIVEQLLDTLIAKDTKEGVGCDNMTAILIMLHQ